MGKGEEVDEALRDGARRSIYCGMTLSTFAPAWWAGRCISYRGSSELLSPLPPSMERRHDGHAGFVARSAQNRNRSFRVFANQASGSEQQPDLNARASYHRNSAVDMDTTVQHCTARCTALQARTSVDGDCKRGHRWLLVPTPTGKTRKRTTIPPPPPIAWPSITRKA